jgi:hypothetical protein
MGRMNLYSRQPDALRPRFAALLRAVELGVKRLRIRFGSAEPINLAIEKAARATGDLFELEFG